MSCAATAGQCWMASPSRCHPFTKSYTSYSTDMGSYMRGTLIVALAAQTHRYPIRSLLYTRFPTTHLLHCELVEMTVTVQLSLLAELHGIAANRARRLVHTWTSLYLLLRFPVRSVQLLSVSAWPDVFVSQTKIS